MTEKVIDTLVSDIEGVLLNGMPPSDTFFELTDKYGKLFTELLRSKFAADQRQRKPELRFSNIGKPCERQLYFDVNGYEGETFRPETYMKFAYGDMTELLLFFLVEASGHRLEGQQDTMEIEGVLGHRDGAIDGVTVDAKSASSRSFEKFKKGELKDNDPFGYIDQLQSYLHAGQDDPIITDKSRAAFLVLDKTLGHICLDVHEKSTVPYDAVFRYKKSVVESPEIPPRAFEPVPMGKSGNMKLSSECSYCAFKKECWPEMRSFLYSNGPVYLTTIVEIPKVPELVDVS